MRKQPVFIYLSCRKYRQNILHLQCRDGKNGQNCALFAFIRLYFVPSIIVLQLFFVEAAGFEPARFCSILPFGTFTLVSVFERTPSRVAVKADGFLPCSAVPFLVNRFIPCVFLFRHASVYPRSSRIPCHLWRTSGWACGVVVLYYDKYHMVALAGLFRYFQELRRNAV